MKAIQSGVVQNDKTTYDYTLRTNSPQVAVKSKVEDKHTLDAEHQKLRFSELNKEEKEAFYEEVKKHNEAFAYTGKYLKFKFDEETETSYVEVIDASTHEVIVSLPPEFLIELSSKLKEILGLVIDEKL